MAHLPIMFSWKKRIRYHSDPAKVFYQLCQGRTNTLLLESSAVRNYEKIESKLIVDSALRITAINNIVTIQALSHNGSSLLPLLDSVVPSSMMVERTETRLNIRFLRHTISTDEEHQRLIQTSIFDCFRWIVQVIQGSLKEWKTLFLGGLFAYDLIHSFEDVPKNNHPSPCPDICFYLAESVITINHQHKTAVIQAYSFSSKSSERNRLCARIQQVDDCMRMNTFSIIPPAPLKKITVTTNINDIQYAHMINQMRVFIAQGEVFQVVPSRQFYCSCTHPLLTYRILKRNNPSPYMFFMQDKHFILFGASPESYLKYDANHRIIALHPIAGTRSRGLHVNGSIDLDLDNRIELSLRTNQKELSEHLMLVDLARNDLAKVCQYNSRHVSQLMAVEKYSHVMHLVSHVTGILRADLDIFHAYQSCMNMGTLTGAPKLRAMQLIAQSEPVCRGSYGGSVGYFTGDGSFDACIVIRSAFVRDHRATIQSGAGIVYDSVTTDEVLESTNKAQAVLQSIIHTHQRDRGKFYV
ncbi:anthranilate synthase component 1 [Buchnera aphidicola]|uniref:Anthranilate synthase component 1 n=1 Tax=Buchnera aphidicola (Cinara strobi) TaxID=1921549 RepID=A0A3B1E3J9_9GAMM|nr:anthranilate synthase component 1 [Buchnera aphidicola]VAX77190.1 Anthranilate synthase component 1 [Buchnera aphidicola (Cinara strobi)]